MGTHSQLCTTADDLWEFSILILEIYGGYLSEECILVAMSFVGFGWLDGPPNYLQSRLCMIRWTRWKAISP